MTLAGFLCRVTVLIAVTTLLLSLPANGQTFGTRVSVALTGEESESKPKVAVTPTSIITASVVKDSTDTIQFSVSDTSPLPTSLTLITATMTAQIQFIASIEYVPAASSVVIAFGSEDASTSTLALCPVSNLATGCEEVAVDSQEGETMLAIVNQASSTIFVLFRDSNNGDEFSIMACTIGPLACGTPVQNVLNGEGDDELFLSMIHTPSGILISYYDSTGETTNVVTCTNSLASCSSPTTLSLSPSPLRSIVQVSLDATRQQVIGVGSVDDLVYAFACSEDGVTCTTLAFDSVPMTDENAAITFPPNDGTGMVTSTHLFFAYGERSGVLDRENIGLIMCSLTAWLDNGAPFETACTSYDLVGALGLPRGESFGQSVAFATDPGESLSATTFVLAIEGNTDYGVISIDYSACNTGEVASLIDCVPCPAGTFFRASDADCVLCPQGTYSSSAGATSCTPCQDDVPGQAAACLPGSTLDLAAFSAGLSGSAGASISGRGNETVSYPAVRATYSPTKFADPDRVADIVFVLVVVWLTLSLFVLAVFLVLVLLSSSSHTEKGGVAGKVLAAFAAIDIFFRVEKVSTPARGGSDLNSGSSHDGSGDDDDDDDDDEGRKGATTVLAQRRSPLGGMFAVVAVIGLVVVIMALSFRFGLDNATVVTTQNPSRFVLPTVLLEPDVRVTFSLLGVAPESCVASPGVEGEQACGSTVRLSTQSVSSQSRVSHTCSVPVSGLCRVVVTCVECVLVERPLFSVGLGIGTSYGRQSLVDIAIARAGVAFGAPEASGSASVFVTPTTSTRVFQAPATDAFGSIIETTAYQTGHFDRRSSESNPESVFGFALTEGILVTRGQEVELSALTFVPPAQATPLGVRINPAQFHTTTNVREVESFLAFAGLVGGALSALFGILATVVKSLERFGKVVPLKPWKRNASLVGGGGGLGGAALKARLEEEESGGEYTFATDDDDLDDDDDDDDGFESSE